MSKWHYIYVNQDDGVVELFDDLDTAMKYVVEQLGENNKWGFSHQSDFRNIWRYGEEGFIYERFINRK